VCKIRDCLRDPSRVLQPRSYSADRSDLPLSNHVHPSPSLFFPPTAHFPFSPLRFLPTRLVPSCFRSRLRECGCFTRTIFFFFILPSPFQFVRDVFNEKSLVRVGVSPHGCLRHFDPRLALAGFLESLPPFSPFRSLGPAPPKTFLQTSASRRVPLSFPPNSPFPSVLDQMPDKISPSFSRSCCVLLLWHPRFARHNTLAC